MQWNTTNMHSNTQVHYNYTTTTTTKQQLAQVQHHCWWLALRWTPFIQGLQSRLLINTLAFITKPMWRIMRKLVEFVCSFGCN